MTKDELAKKITDILVMDDEKGNGVVDAFKALTNYLELNESELFEPVLETAQYDMKSEHPVVETGYFDFAGVMLFDNTHGKPANKSSYLYRSKGTRTFLTSYSKIAIIGPYSSMDNNACWFTHEIYEIIDINDINTYDDVDFCLRFIGDDEKHHGLTVSQKMLIILSSVNEVLPRGHFIELFLTPPDYQRASKITREILDLIWTRLLVSGGKKVYTEAEIKIATKKLIDVDIAPDFHSFVALINFELTRDVEHIKKVVSYMCQVSMPELNREVKKTNDKNNDFMDIKPGIFGVNININAFFKWVKNMFRL